MRALCQWQILDDTSLPLSSSVPGVRVSSIFDGELKQSSGGASSPQHERHLAADDSNVNAARLTLSWRFYDFLPRGNSKFGCLAYTLDGRRTVHYFTVHKI